MARNYLYDEDLEFLASVDNKDLETLVDFIIGQKGKRRFNEELTKQKEYKMYMNNYHKYYKEIIHELQLYGGNTFANLYRSHGVRYKEILCDVCDKLKVQYSRSDPVQKIEGCLLAKIIKDTIERMDEKQVRRLAKELGIEKTKTNKLSKEFVLIGMQTLFNAGGFMSYQIAVIIANAVANAVLGHGLTLLGNDRLTKGLSVMVGPIGLLLSGGLIAVKLASPAYRVTIPSCIYIAYLRLKYTQQTQYSQQSRGANREEKTDDTHPRRHYGNYYIDADGTIVYDYSYTYGESSPKMT